MLTRYVEQLVASVEAAVEEVVQRGVNFFTCPRMTIISIAPDESVTVVLVLHILRLLIPANCCWRTFLWCIHDCKPLGTCPPSFLLWNCSLWSLQQNTYTFWLSGTEKWNRSPHPFFFYHVLLIEQQQFFSCFSSLDHYFCHSFGWFFSLSSYWHSTRTELFGRPLLPMLKWVLSCQQIKLKSQYCLSMEKKTIIQER